MSIAVPELPRRVQASSLLHGSDVDFVINAYLALQRQWPDSGGYAHYVFTLRQPGASRATVLREIAASDNARRCGVEFVDDLPQDHSFRPEDHDRGHFTQLSMSLRLARTAGDLEQLRQSLASLTTERLAAGVELIAQRQQAHQAVIESRLSTLESALERGTSADASPANAPAEPSSWVHLARRQMAVEAELDATRQAVQSLAQELAQELAQVRRAMDHLQLYATVELKRQVADYVNALTDAQRAPFVSIPAATTTRRAARAALVVDRAGSRQKAERG
jgi:hypothetical protein